MRRALAPLLALAAHTHALADLGWQQQPPAPWSGRSDACGGVFSDSTIVMAGGHANSAYTNDVWVSHDTGHSWRRVLEQAPWSPRSYHSCVVLPGDRLLLVAGHAGTEWFNDVWVTAPGDASQWTRVTAAAPFAKRAAGSLQYQAATGRVYYMGGSDGLLPPAGFNTTLFNDVWVSGDGGATWAQATAAAGWAAREGFSGQSSGNAVVVAGKSLAVIGGERSYFPSGFFGDVWTTEDGATWVQRQVHAGWAGDGAGRSGHTIAAEAHADGSSTIWLTGGYLGRSDVWCLHVASADDYAKPWTQVATKSAWPGRYDHITHVVGESLVLYGGENSAAGFGGPYYNDVWVTRTLTCA